MSLNQLPFEILDAILKETVKLNQKDGVVYTFGLSQLPELRNRNDVPTNVQRYVKGPTPPYQLKWDASTNLRLVCREWHEWSLNYALSDVYVKLWRGSQRWCDLSLQRDKYPLYEMVQYPRGEKVYRNPYITLHRTREFLENCPHAAAGVRRLWFNGLYVPETDVDVIRILRACKNLTSASIPWTVLRHATPEDWAAILRTDSEFPLKSLELLATSMSTKEVEQIQEAVQQNPLLSPLVDFSKLQRLKLFGNTEVMPICDADLQAIARTATNLEDFQMTCISTITMDGVMAVVRASRNTLRVLEHSPRSDDGFWHPHPGNLSDGEHICSILTSCPKLEDVSISIPTMCPELFANAAVRWKGDCQVRAIGLCGSGASRTNRSHDELRKLLAEARKLIRARASGTFPAALTLELFFADMIFDPHLECVHGDFQEAEFVSGEGWPGSKTRSRKGPYGSTGLYGKEEEGLFECISEDEMFAGLARNYIQI